MPDRKDIDLLRLARERYERGVEAERDNREEQMDDLRFRAGDQWPEGVKQERAADERPCLTVNKMPQFVRQVTGDIRLNKPAIKVKPVSGGADPERAEIFTGLIRNIEHASHAQTAYSTAADNSAACGQGAFRIDTEFADDDLFEQDIRIRRITNPFAVVWDPDAQEVTKEDARYCFVLEELGVAEFKDRYPQAATADFESDEPHRGLSHWRSGENIVIAEYWVKEPTQKTLAMLPDGSVRDITDIAEPQRAALAIVRQREVRSDKIKQYIISGVEVLEGPTDWAGRFIPIVPVVGEEVHVGRETRVHGLVRFAKDPQRIYNYNRSAATEATSLAPKAPFVGTVKMFAGLEKWWRQANRKNLAYLPYNPDPEAPNSKPERQPGPEVQLAYAQEAGIAAQDMNATTGIHPPSLGEASNEKSGVAITARQREGDVGTFVYIDNLALAIAHAGRILVDLIPRIYDSTRTERILGEDDSEQFVTLNQPAEDPETGQTVLLNDLSVGKYDVAVVTGPSFTTKRNEAARSMFDFVRAAPETASIVMDLLAKNLDWPGAEEMAKRFRKLAVARGFAEPEEGEEPPEPPPEQIAEAQKLQAEAQKMQIDALKAQLDLVKAQAEAEKIAAETEGQEIENVQGALELSLQSGQMAEIVDAAVARVLAEIAQS